MQHDGEAGQALADLLQHVEAQGRRHQDALLIDGALLGLELIRAVAGADGNSQGVAAGLGYELLNLLGTGVGRCVEEASIITEVKPPSMQLLQVSKSGP